MSDKSEYERLSEAKNELVAELKSYSDNVISVGIGHKNDTEELCISVGVNKKVPEDQLRNDEIIPSVVETKDGYSAKTDVIEIGDIEPEVLMSETHIDRMGRHRPVPLGVSVGHPDITAGTVGWLYETSDGRTFAGTNNHVAANSNNGSVGDPVIQPGTADGGVTPDDDIGTLEYYVPLEDGVDVDLALVELGVQHDNTLVDVDSPITGVADSVSLDDELVKSGRTTGVTRGIVQQINASVSVNYGGDLGSVQIEGCIITGDMSDGGDSGSAVAKEVNGELRAVGRLFAGSDSATVHHHINSELGHLESGFDSTIQLITDEGDGGGDVPTAQVSLTLTQESPDTGNIEATVSDEGGGPVTDATVGIEGPVTSNLTTGIEGTTTFSDVPIGDYTVSADKEGYGEDSTTIEAGQFS